MSQQHYVIYIPGLGDDRTFGQDLAIKLWRAYGLRGRYHAVGWATEEPFELKLQRLTAVIDGYYKAGHKVSLIGFSAGASAVLNAYAARPASISGVICISGKIQHPETVHPRRYERNPAFRESMGMVATSLGALDHELRKRMLTVYPVVDPVVELEDARIDGVREIRIPGRTHTASIAYALTISSPLLAGFLKRQTPMGS